MNVFDNGSIGNYWGDILPNTPMPKEIGNTGIYNTPYVIDGNITDGYPLTTSYAVESTGAQISVTSSPHPTLSQTSTSTSAIPELTYCALPITVIFAVITATAVVFKKVRYPFIPKEA